MRKGNYKMKTNHSDLNQSSIDKTTRKNTRKNKTAKRKDSDFVSSKKEINHDVRSQYLREIRLILRN